MVHLGADVLVVYAANGGHCFIRDRRQVGGGAVFARLFGTLRAGNCACDALVHENPAQRELRERPPGRADGLQLFDCLQARFVVDAGKRFAAVELFAVPIEFAVVGRFELRVAAASCR